MSETLRKLLDQEVERRGDEFIKLLQRFTQQPSISATGEGIHECATLLADIMSSWGIDVEILETDGNPIVTGTVGDGMPHLVIYGHYDVQPPGDVKDWLDGPFSATIRDGSIWGRGVGDNKGQLLAQLAATSVWQSVTGTPPPIKVTYVFDGEEEIGSPNTARLIATSPSQFSGDFLYTADASTLEMAEPAIYLGVRGLLYIQLSTRGSDSEWHSGSYGSLIPNPIDRLIAALTNIVQDGHLAVPGTQERVRSPSENDELASASLPKSFLADPSYFGSERFLSESPRHDMFFRPQVCICGIEGGYIGPGVKTAVPTEATAKVDITLVPDQNPSEVADLIRRHLDDIGFHDVDLEILASCTPIVTPADHPVVELVKQSMRDVWSREPIVFPSIGGGGPLATFTEHCNMPAMLVAYAQPDLHEHSANEHLSIKSFLNGIRVTAQLFDRLAERGEL